MGIGLGPCRVREFSVLSCSPRLFLTFRFGSRVSLSCQATLETASAS